MSPDDIDSITVKLHDFLVQELGAALDEDEDFEALADFMQDTLDPFITRDRNYN